MADECHYDLWRYFGLSPTLIDHRNTNFLKRIDFTRIFPLETMIDANFRDDDFFKPFPVSRKSIAVIVV